MYTGRWRRWVAERERTARPRAAADPIRPGPPVSDILPGRVSLPALRDAAAGCKACHLSARATQTVFGEGPRQADVMMVGEQPGDVEDVEGHPFVGPAG